MKIFILDSIDLFNDMMFTIISLNKDKFKQIDGRILYIGNIPKYNEVKTDFAVFIDSMKNKYDAVHVLVSKQMPIFKYSNVVLNYKPLYEFFIKAVDSVSKSDFLSISVYIHEYSTLVEAKQILQNLKLSTGKENIEIYQSKHRKIFAIT